jgi:hypothetical protein
MQRLRALGPAILAGEHRVVLRGVNLSGLEYSRGAISPRDLDEVAAWGANLVRVPFNQEWLLDDATYLDELSQVAALAAARGIYVLFDLQWLAWGQERGSNPDGSNVATPPLPDENSPRTWQKLAARFGEDPSILFDLLNEPHDRLRDDRFPLLAADGTPLHSPVVTTSIWHAWARRLHDEIRPFAPHTLLFVSGVDWGFHCAPLDLPGIVHAAHVYPHPGKSTRADWERGFGALCRTRPVVVTELGPVDNLAPVEELLDYLDALGLGWAAWSWRDAPALTENGAPTAFGQLVRARLTRRSVAVA